jgi:hypothetical protein
MLDSEPTKAYLARPHSAGRWCTHFPGRVSGRNRPDVKVFGWRSSTVEHLFCKQGVAGSNPVASSAGGMGESGTISESCPSGQREQTVNLPAIAYDGSNPSLSTKTSICGRSSVGRASAFQAERRGFESHRPLQCPGSSVAEHSLGKGEVVSSILIWGSKTR